MDQNELLLGIERMRSDSNYYAAEVMRRDVGTEALVAPGSTKEGRAAAQLLIVTWESIAILIRGIRTKDKIYEATPICHMYKELEPAIKHFRKEVPEFAAEFEKLNADYLAWLKKKKKSGDYVSRACGGLLHARFG
ncbi:hypothetical protein [Bradyrhizobium sp. AUGA SZCCT0283]|uniref:hypothetical protein n=1 Tax=Bradyrhizobium sp. AUGA SZCCT0283 TaxID=2807671 RepID=UPI001BACB555|nr:hypothetical protein [Bradyrhizobium sp. AUGA SZCCT0283]MBR1273877.1 hypothetical protein [Bradyrhizobium sp. AUGA SZCCT0283]